VKVGFRRHKLNSCVWAIVGAAWAVACAAMTSMAAWMPPIVVGKKVPSSSRARLRAVWRRLRHLFATMCVARWRVVLEAPPAKKAPRALGQQRSPACTRSCGWGEVSPWRRRVTWPSPWVVRRWQRSSLLVERVPVHTGQVNHGWTVGMGRSGGAARPGGIGVARGEGMLGEAKGWGGGGGKGA